ncbi:MAG: CBS domain-containing protein [candidate division Zixibacteria bacterium]|nr:CBS domain-containing protein [candidate division Zixibacteria bacterium]
MPNQVGAGIVGRFVKSVTNFKASERRVLIILSVLVGVGGGLGAVIFRWLIGFFHKVFFDYGTLLFSQATSQPNWLIPLIPAAGGLLVAPITYRLAKEARGHGVPEVMLAVALRGGIIRPLIALAKSIASSICIGSGGSAGREGPIVQIGSALGSTVGQLFRMSGERVKILVGCGAAAGISATFNAPIAGVLFALEIILGDFTMYAFSPVILSSVVATIISRAFLGNYPAFIVPAYDLVSVWEMPMYIGLGLVAGVFSVVFIKALYKSEDIFEALRINNSLKPALGGLILGTIGIFYPQLFGVGYEAISAALQEQTVVGVLILLAFLKIVGTSLTLGSGGSGGVFAPSLFMGAMLGGFFGYLVNLAFPEVTASYGAYALVGMSAVVAGTTHAPITAMLIIFEMTGDYRIILPLMLASVISTLLANKLNRDSIYTLKLSRRGISLKAGKDRTLLEGISVQEVMTTSWQALPQNMPLSQLLQFVEQSREDVFPVLNPRGELAGILTLQDIRSVVTKRVLEDLVIVEDIISHNYPTATLDENLASALSKFQVRDLEGLPVVDKYNPKKLLGILKRADIISFYNKRLLEQEALRKT